MKTFGSSRLRIALPLLLAVLASAALAACGGDKPLPAGLDDGIPATATSAASVHAAPTLPPPTPAPTAPLPAADNAGGTTLYLLPFEGFPQQRLERLQAYFLEKHGIRFGLLPSIAIPRDAIDLERGQLVGEQLIETIATDGSGYNPGDVVIGVTQYDMMITGRSEWQFSFALRDIPRRIGVVSTARMDPLNFGLPPDEDTLFLRTAKMVAKHVGILHLGLELSDDPRSVMYGSVLSVDDLDRMGEEF